ncbi:MAG TPA: hypothetical protein VF511_07090 [Chthoniobacterales bacterium]
MTDAVRLPQSEPTSPAEPRLALDWERLRFERQKLALELRHERRKLKAERGESPWRALLANPLTVAIVGGILTLMTTILTNFFTSKANRESAKQSLQAEMIKKFVESPTTQTVRGNLQFLIDAGLLPDYADGIRHYLATNAGAPQVGGVEFAPAGERVSEALKAQLSETLKNFRTFLLSKGFAELDDNIAVFIYSRETGLPTGSPFPSDTRNSFYLNKTLYIHKDFSQDVSIALREYSHHALLKTLDPDLFQQTEVESALADYFPAAFLNTPVIGKELGRFLNLPTSFLRTIDNTLTYDAASNDNPDAWFYRGIVWAGALWACRQKAGRESVDNVILNAWRQANIPPITSTRVAERFGAALAKAPGPVGECFVQEIASRRLPRSGNP